LKLQAEDIEKIFSDFSKLNVLIIGDVMIDSYMWGKVNRISPEAPVPVVSVTKKENRPGGAANVALNVKAMGANPVLCSVIGEDLYGKLFLELLGNYGLSSEGIVTGINRTTTVKTRVIASSQQMIRVDEEQENDIETQDTEKLFAVIKILIETKKADVIIFEDYDKGIITPKLIKMVLQYAGEKNIPVTVDPKKKNFNNYKGVTLFKPNFKELKEGLKFDYSIHDTEEIKALLNDFVVSNNFSGVLLTLSEKGVLYSNGKDTIHVPAHLRKIADVSGAGDTVITVASLCLALNLPQHFSASLANLSGGLVCESIGVVPIDKQKLKNEAMRLLIQ
jgi:D-glycero-beta-D-manno-heptose-7-phosphate kinase